MLETQSELSETRPCIERECTNSRGKMRHIPADMMQRVPGKPKHGPTARTWTPRAGNRTDSLPEDSCQKARFGRQLKPSHGVLNGFSDPSTGPCWTRSAIGPAITISHPRQTQFSSPTQSTKPGALFCAIQCGHHKRTDPASSAAARSPRRAALGGTLAMSQCPHPVFEV